MKILLTAKYTPAGDRPIGGVQSWIATIANEFERMGHEVGIYEPNQTPSQQYDLGIFANIKRTKRLLNFVNASILISHGIIDEEAPSTDTDIVMCVSEGVRSHWGLFCDIVRQPIDLKFWSDTGDLRRSLVRYSYRTAPIKVSADCHHVRDKTHEEARDILRSACCVYATGRGALEAMACGAPVVIYDHRQAYQGALLGPEDLLTNMMNSYSGRGGFVPNYAQVEARTNKAIEQGSQRSWVETHHDSAKIAKQLLQAI